MERIVLESIYCVTKSPLYRYVSVLMLLLGYSC